MEWHTEIRKVSELKKWEENPRTISEGEYAKLKKSITKRGFHDILKIDEKNVVLSGNQRLDALKELDYKEVECKVADKILTQEEKDAVALESNIQGGEWDMDKLAEGFEDILEELGADDLMPEIVEEVEEDDYEEPEDLETTVVLGDVYQLGEHRLVCGDSTKIEDVEKLMNGEKADMVFTDPPYGMNLDVSSSDNLVGKGKWKNKAKHYTPVIGDDEDYDPTHLFEMFPDTKELFLWGFDYFAEFIPNRKEGSVIVWDKRKGVEDTKLTFSEFELCWSREKHLREIVRITWSGLLGTEQEFDHKRHHPTQKPIKLSSWFIEKYSEESNLVVDLFGGSGSTLIACEQTNRKCYMMELDPHYCQVIIDRWEKLTNMEAKKL